MTDKDSGASPQTPPEISTDAAAHERAARTRFLVISLFRLSGVLIMAFGLAIALRHFGWVPENNAKIMGGIFVCVGFVQTVIVPRVLISAWRTPKA